MATTIFESVDFKSPLTQSLFDRTPEQRHHHSELVVRFAGEAGASELADRKMFEEFFGSVRTLINDKAEVYVSDAVKHGPTVDEVLCASLALQDVRQEIALLHEVLPLPMLERMVEV